MQYEGQQLLVRAAKDPSNPRALKHWQQLRLTLRAIVLFKHPAVEVVVDLDQLACEVENAPYEPQNSRRTGLSYAVSDYRLVQGLFSRIARGSATDLNEVEALLEKNDSLDTHEEGNSLVNRRSMSGKTLFYEAATQGNLPAVQLLLRHGADASQPSKTGGEMETPLEAACRWGHIQVAELLLIQHQWTKEELKAAHKATRNAELKSSIRRVLGKAKHWCCWR